MVAEWLVLAESAATALLGAAATDIWKSARSGIIAMFHRGGFARQDLAAELLDETAGAVERASPEGRDEVRQQLVDAWKVRLADLMREFPEAADEVRSWTDTVRAQLPHAQQQWVQTNVARDHGVVFGVQGGNQHVYYDQAAADRGADEAAEAEPE